MYLWNYTDNIQLAKLTWNLVIHFQNLGMNIKYFQRESTFSGRYEIFFRVFLNVRAMINCYIREVNCTITLLIRLL